MKLEGTIRIVIEKALGKLLHERGTAYGTTAFNSLVNNSIRLCEKTNGKEGIRPSTLLMALQDACDELDAERAYASALRQQLQGSPFSADQAAFTDEDFEVDEDYEDYGREP